MVRWRSEAWPSFNPLVFVPTHIELLGHVYLLPVQVIAASEAQPQCVHYYFLKDSALMSFGRSCNQG